MSRSGRPADPPLVTVVVPCLDQAELLDGCLRALAAQEDAPPFEVVVADAAEDPEVKAAVARFPGVRLVRSDLGLAPGTARNLGVEAARGALLAFTDADCAPEPGWVAAAVAGLESGARMVGGPILHARPFQPIAAADNLQQFAEFPSTRPEGEATHFPSCNVALTTEDFRTAGGFADERLGEDLLLSRAMAERWPGGLRFVSGMRVRHLGRTGFIAMLVHNARLGEWRGRLGLRVGTLQLRLGRSGLAVLPFAAWRWVYIVRTTLRWHPRGLPRVLLLSPLLIPGLVAWSIGFRRGARARAPGATNEERVPSQKTE